MIRRRPERPRWSHPGRRIWRLSVTGGLATWFLVTAASQHPNRMFDVFRRLDRASLLIPNWRFFAPEPARHDFHILHRVLTDEGEQTGWRETMKYETRTWLQTFWFPDRRRDKAVFDVCHELLRYMETSSDHVMRCPAYLLIQDIVEEAVRGEFADGPLPKGFQFIVVRHTGHDPDHDPDYILASHFLAL